MGGKGRHGRLRRQEGSPVGLEWEERGDGSNEISGFDIDETTSLARELSARVGGESVPHIAVFVEGFSDFLSTPADAALVELIKLIKRSDHFFVAEAETAGWGSSWPLLGEVKSARRGIILQPDPMDGDQIMRTPFPKVSRAEFPPGRGYLVRGGRVTRV